MNLKNHRLAGSILGGLALALAFAASVPSARANVYATNLKLNGATNNAVVAPGGGVSISYLLNEPATLGVTIEILAGTNVVRGINVAAGSPGATRGANTMVWDGKSDGGANVALGSYGVSITAAASGYTNWTQISDDTAPSSYCNRPRGIAVDNNPRSPFYGRIFIGNSLKGPGISTNAWGDVPGIYKVNADGSYSDDGAGRYGTAGYDFSDAAHYDGGDNPLNMKVREDDRLYWNNWVGKGEIVSCDMLLATNQIVMPEGAYSGNPYFPGDNWKTFEVTDVLTDHARLYLCDANFPSGGAWYWPMTNGIADPSDPNYTSGYQAVQTGGDLSLRCDGIAIDAKTNVYVIQNRANAGDPNMRAACFTNWDETTTLSTGAAWVVGGGDDTFRALYNLALDSVPNPRYLAVALYSLLTNSVSAGVPWAGIRILNAADGSTVVSNLSFSATYYGVDWDNAGNLYGGSPSDHRWRVFSPPGTNQATTVALATVQVAVPIQIPNIAVVNGTNVTINFTAATNHSAAEFKLQSAGVVTGPYADVPGAAATQLSPGLFQFTTPVPGSNQFYRVRR